MAGVKGARVIELAADTYLNDLADIESDGGCQEEE
jgi:hypothetical protein